jgi:hypothetical protein
MRRFVKFLTIAEIEIDSEVGAPVEEAQAILDAFREATLPSQNHGVTLYRAMPDDLTHELLQRQVELVPLSESDGD